MHSNERPATDWIISGAIKMCCKAWDGGLYPVPLSGMQYYIRQKGKVNGPYTIEQLRSMRSSGAFTEGTTFCAEGSDHWHGLRQFVNYLDVASETGIETPGKNWTKQKIWAASAAGCGLVVAFCGLPTVGTAMIVAGGIGFIAAQYGGWGTRKNKSLE